jgi:hypothetical protein
MKTTRYRFEQAVQEVKQDTTNWLTDEFKSILESDKDFTRKADYIGLSIANIDNKVASIDEEIKELQSLKKQLKVAKELTLITGAKVLTEYGIDKIEGAGISSITISKPSEKITSTLIITDAAALINLGYCKTVLDEDAVKVALDKEAWSLSQYCEIQSTTSTTEPKLKINKRRSSSKAEELTL